jgi:prepilin-type N-terminal cleavage/methylation domain-containing protein
MHREIDQARAPARPPLRLRRGVTLVELMITMAILAILAAAAIGASSAAIESGRRARTKGLVGKLHTLLMERWESYDTRRVNVEFAPNVKWSPTDKADKRLLAKRELIKMEIPDRWADIIGGQIASYPPGTRLNGFPRPKHLAARPAITSTYLRRYNSLKSSDPVVVRNHQGAECLYLVIMYATGDGEAATLFSEQDIGDVDGDGAPEFLDGWGRPISFLRWPTGFVSPLQTVQRTSGELVGDADNDHDPTDVFRRDMPGSGSSISFLSDQYGAYRTVPLIYSFGSDGLSDIYSKLINEADEVSEDRGDFTDLDPYYPGDTSNPANPSNPSRQFGQVYDDNQDGENNSLDNIHNHLIE